MVNDRSKNRWVIASQFANWRGNPLTFRGNLNFLSGNSCRRMTDPGNSKTQSSYFFLRTGRSPHQSADWFAMTGCFLHAPIFQISIYRTAPSDGKAPERQALRGDVRKITCTARASRWSPPSGTERYRGKRSERRRPRRQHSRPRQRGLPACRCGQTGPTCRTRCRKPR